ncbi:MAG: rRNA pseudouridine synthase [Proteobacteria bacterium]|nr:rRNA pseudouridine synthase [Pseudomonadota bacterium]
MVHGQKRLAKHLAHLGVCSRREAEKLIVSGAVCVNGQIITDPAVNVHSSDHILVHQKKVATCLTPRLFAYYKPKGLITTHRDPQGRPTVFDNISKNFGRLISIGRLDINSEGLLLLTNNPSLAHCAESPHTNWPRKYRVRIYGDLTNLDLLKLKKGLTIDGMRYKPIDVDITQEGSCNHWLFITLYEGKNREIRRVMEYFGLQVNRLIRVQYGPFCLGSLTPNQLEELYDFEKHFESCL